MNFSIFIAVILATVALAAPAEDTKAATITSADKSSALDNVLSNSPARHQPEEDGPAPPDCYWHGTAPLCLGNCPIGYKEEERRSCADGTCCFVGYKSLCCKIQN